MSKEEGSTQKKGIVVSLKLLYGRYAVAIVPQSLAHLACLSICLYSYLSMSSNIYRLFHQKKASPGEHFKFDNNKPFCQQFVSVNKFVFAALLDLKGSSNSKILCFFTFLLYFRATLLTTFELIVYVLDWWQGLSKQNEPPAFQTRP